ncbi:MAG: hypothetical protein JO087_02645, partial [Actinobacteria bacterium]|nr:hypothetical protein [Actinomycetota bacterium]
LLAVLVILLTPADEIGRVGQLALRVGVVVAAVTFLAAVFGATSVAANRSTMQIWVTFVLPQLLAAVPAAIAVRLAQNALAGR